MGSCFGLALRTFQRKYQTWSLSPLILTSMGSKRCGLLRYHYQGKVYTLALPYKRNFEAPLQVKLLSTGLPLDVTQPQGFPYSYTADEIGGSGFHVVTLTQEVTLDANTRPDTLPTRADSTEDIVLT